MVLLISHKHLYSTRRLLEEAEKIGLAIEVLDPEDLLGGKKPDPSHYQLLYVRSAFAHKSAAALPAIVNLAGQFEKFGKPVIDSGISRGNLALGKWHEYTKLKAADIPVPVTVPFLECSNEQLSNKILKWIYGMKARDVFFIGNRNEAEGILPKHPFSEWLVQDYIAAEWEYKVVCVGFKSLPVVVKYKSKTNALGMDFNSYSILKAESLPKVVDLAQKASKALARELVKVDIVEASGRLYVLEVNRNPGLSDFERASKYNAFGKFATYLQAICRKQPVLV